MSQETSLPLGQRPIRSKGEAVRFLFLILCGLSWIVWILFSCYPALDLLHGTSAAPAWVSWVFVATSAFVPISWWLVGMAASKTKPVRKIVKAWFVRQLPAMAVYGFVWTTAYLLIGY